MTPRIYVSVLNKEVEKPQGGGGKGKELPYSITISVDGEKVLYLTRNNFPEKPPGLMEKFLEAMQEISAPDIGSTMPPKTKRK